MWIRLPRSSTERRSTSFFSAAASAGVTADEIRQRARSVLEHDYQAELPEGPRVPNVDLPSLGILADLAQVTLVALGVVALILAVLWLAQSLSSKRERSPAAPGEPGYLPEEPASATGPSLAEAERLAAEGR